MEGFKTLLYKGACVSGRSASRPVLAPVLTAVLYLLIFGHVLDDHVQPFRASATRPFWCRPGDDDGAAERLLPTAPRR